MQLNAITKQKHIRDQVAVHLNSHAGWHHTSSPGAALRLEAQSSAEHA
jgi:hypothetical protein